MGLDYRRALYACAVFWSALLLLLLQPVLTKAILPWFGGSAGVWSTSMLFFQLVLLLGYLYAHLLTRHLSSRAQALVHGALLVVALLLLPLAPASGWKPQGNEAPAPRILGLLLSSAGLPYFLLATTSPLLQAWYARTFRSEMPWRLYAVSNLGSLAALLLYPVAVEPTLTVHDQLGGWSIGFVLFAVLACVAGLMAAKSPAETRKGEQTLPDGASMLTWLALAATPSVLWLAVGNQLSQDVAAVPFLWILPLAIYLSTFVLTFDSDRWYKQPVFRWLLPVAWLALLGVVSQQGFLPFVWTIVLYGAALFVLCMFCHGELARLKPHASQLTAFYLVLAAGGALGGLFVSVAAPVLFTEYLELPIAVLGTVMLALWLLYRLPRKRVIRIGGVAAAGTVAALVTRGTGFDYQINIRNFYGTLQVSEARSDIGPYRALYNGTIQHGLQFRAGGRTRIPTTYYGPASGAAIALKAMEARGPLRVGVIGLGVGTMAAYSRPGDYYRFYEINPAVIDIARTQFTYLKESRGTTDVVAGDARLVLEREEPGRFDLLIVDAFSGDSIPVHLLTREAFREYFRHITPGGALAVHVTNKHLDLAPVVEKAASEMNASAMLIHNSKEEARRIHLSSWMIVSRDRDLQQQLGWLSNPIPQRAGLRLWTDDYSNLFAILKRR